MPTIGSTCRKTTATRKSFLISILIATLVGACANEPDAADLILVNGNFFTANPSAVKANAVAIRDGKFLFVGDDSGASAFAGPNTQKYDLAGAMVIPGIVDSHTHPGLIARTTDELVLPAYASKSIVLDTVAKYAIANPDAEFIVGK
jgi:predicted amidohydrolase YtcJ